MHVVKKGCSLLSHFLYGHFERYRGTPQRIYQSNRTCTCERPKTQSSLQCLMTFTCRNYDDGCNICVQNFCFSILWSLLKHCIQFAFSDPVNSSRTRQRQGVFFLLNKYHHSPKSYVSFFSMIDSSDWLLGYKTSFFASLFSLWTCSFWTGVKERQGVSRANYWIIVLNRLYYFNILTGRF